MNSNYINISKRKSVDKITLFLFILISLFGLLNIYSSSLPTDGIFLQDLTGRFSRQFIWLCLSFGVAFIIFQIDNLVIQTSAYIIYLVAIGLLLLTLVLGVTVSASKSWISIAGIRLQPSEFAKFATALALGSYYGSFDKTFKNKKDRLTGIAIVLVPMCLVFLQNDTGSSLVFLSFIFVFFRLGLSGWWLVLGFWSILIFVLAIYFGLSYTLIFIVTLALILAFIFRKNKNILYIIGVSTLLSVGYTSSAHYIFNSILQKHQQHRILVILNKVQDPIGVGYQVRQSKIAIGSGGLFGKGAGHGTHTKMGFVPEQSTDFIFSTIGEEWGFVGSSIFIILYVIFLIRILVLADRQNNEFSKIMGYSLFSVLFLHFAINIAMTIKLAPVIGIPLPFVSAGGSSFLSFTIFLIVFLKLCKD